MMKKKHMALFCVLSFLLIVTVWVFALDYPSLPERVPTHFDAAGNPDAWGSKATLLLFPGLQVLFFGISLIVYRYPNYANIPFTIALKYLPREIMEKAYELMRDTILITMCITSFLMLYLSRESLGVAKGLTTAIDLLPMWIILVCLAPPTVYYAVKMRRLG